MHDLPHANSLYFRFRRCSHSRRHCAVVTSAELIIAISRRDFAARHDWAAMGFRPEAACGTQARLAYTPATMTLLMAATISSMRPPISLAHYAFEDAAFREMMPNKRPWAPPRIRATPLPSNTPHGRRPITPLTPIFQDKAAIMPPVYYLNAIDFRHFRCDISY